MPKWQYLAIGAVALYLLSRGREAVSMPPTDVGSPVPVETPDPRTYASSDPFRDYETTGTTPLGTSASRDELKADFSDLTALSPARRMLQLGGSRGGGGVV